MKMKRAVKMINNDKKVETLKNKKKKCLDCLVILDRERDA